MDAPPVQHPCRNAPADAAVVVAVKQEAGGPAPRQQEPALAGEAVPAGWPQTADEKLKGITELGILQVL